MKYSVATLLFLFVFSTVLLGQQPSGGIPYGNNPEAGHYAEVNGVKLYYEEYGEGAPLLLIHGNGGSIQGHGGRIAYFSQHYRVIAADSRSHGKSQDLGDSLTYKQMTADLNALLEHLGVDSCYIWGQSDGGIIGLRMAMDYPDKVKRVAIFGANLRPDTTAVFPSIVQWVEETMATTTDERQRRLFALMKYQPQIATQDLARVQVPVLVMSGDRDAIRLEHTVEIFHALPQANLLVMPGATHFGAYEKPDLFNSLLEAFFTQPFSTKATTDIFK